ncbi:unnamed protein product [Trichobilharzia szidati]|nr:unnamed protein product [Trichobilharzia szidati]
MLLSRIYCKFQHFQRKRRRCLLLNQKRLEFKYRLHLWVGNNDLMVTRRARTPLIHLDPVQWPTHEFQLLRIHARNSATGTSQCYRWRLFVLMSDLLYPTGHEFSLEVMKSPEHGQNSCPVLPGFPMSSHDEIVKQILFYDQTLLGHRKEADS